MEIEQNVLMEEMGIDELDMEEDDIFDDGFDMEEEDNTETIEEEGAEEDIDTM